MAGSGITVVVDAQNNTAAAFGSAAKGVKTVGEAADVAAKQLKDMDAKLESADIKARRLAQAEEKAAERTRHLAAGLAAARHELEASGDASGTLARKMDRLAVDTRFAAEATEEYRRQANRAAADAREQARAYDRVADNARQAARAVTMLGAAAALSPNRKGGSALSAGGGLLSDISSGFLKGGFGGASSALEGTLGTPIVGPALLAAGAAAAVPAASFLGGAAGGGILAGAGAAGAGLGLAGAWANDPEKYASAWGAATDKIKKRWLDSSAAFGNELDGVLKVADQTMQRLPIEKILALSQSFVAPLATGAGEGLAGVANGSADALEKVQPVIDKIGPKIGNLGHDIGDAFRMISEGSKGGGDALGDLIDAIGYAVKVTGIMILGFENTYESMRNFAIGAFHVADSLGPLADAADLVYRSLFTIDNTSTVLARTLDDTGSAAHDTAYDWGEMAEAAADAAVNAIGLNDALTDLRNTQLAAADASLAIAQGWLDLSSELKDGAKSLDANTQAGIDNQKAILGQVELLEQKREQDIKTGDQTQASMDQANAAYAAGVEQLKAVARAAGFTDDQINRLLATYGAVPPNVTTNIQTPGLAESLHQGESLRQRLDQIDGRVVTANVYVAYHTQGQSLNAPLRTGGIGHAAAGGAQGGLTEVGEDGPELVRLPTGTMVYPRANRNQMMAQGGGHAGRSIEATMHITGSGALYEAVMAGQRSGEVQIFASAIVDR